jgi:hypothetical protein
VDIYNARLRREPYKNNMELDKISRIESAKFFDTESPENTAINNALISLCKMIFMEAYNNEGKEAGAVFNIKTKEYAIHDATKYNEVNFKDDLKSDYRKLMDKSADYSYIVLHTHNSVSSFSSTDVRSLVSDDKAIAIIVVTSDANIFILTREKFKNYSEVVEVIDSTYKTNDITSEIKEVMLKNNLIVKKRTT